MLRSVLGVAAAAIGTGTLLEAQTGTASANGTEGPTKFVGNAATPIVTVKNSGSGAAISATNAGASTNAILGNSAIYTAVAGITGSTTNTAAGVFGRGGFVGVAGYVAGANSAPAGAVAVYGSGTNGSNLGAIGVQGDGDTNHGVVGHSNSAEGVVGGSDSGFGVWGYSNSNNGISGQTTSGSGVAGYSVNGAGVYGLTASGNGSYGVFCGGNFAATGTKSALVPLPDGTYVKLYCVESPECWFEDFGRASLLNGVASVALDAGFAAVVQSDDYYVFLAPEGDSKGLYVGTKSATGFTIAEQQGGTSSIAVSYRVVAKRKDVAAPRLEHVTLPKPPQLPQVP